MVLMVTRLKFPPIRPWWAGSRRAIHYIRASFSFSIFFNVFLEKDLRPRGSRSPPCLTHRRSRRGKPYRDDHAVGSWGPAWVVNGREIYRWILGSDRAVVGLVRVPTSPWKTEKPCALLLRGAPLLSCPIIIFFFPLQYIFVPLLPCFCTLAV